MPSSSCRLSRRLLASYAAVNGWRRRPNAGSFDAVMAAADEVAQRHVQCSGEGRQISLVDGLAGFELFDRADEHAGIIGEFVYAVTERDPKAEDARRQRLCRHGAAVPVAPEPATWRRLFGDHRFALMHQNAASSA